MQTNRILRIAYLKNLNTISFNTLFVSFDTRTKNFTCQTVRKKGFVHAELKSLQTTQWSINDNFKKYYFSEQQ